MFICIRRESEIISYIHKRWMALCVFNIYIYYRTNTIGLKIRHFKECQTAAVIIKKEMSVKLSRDTHSW